MDKRSRLRFRRIFVGMFFLSTELKLVISFDISYTIFVISASRKTPDTGNALWHFDAVIAILVSLFGRKSLLLFVPHVRPIIFTLFILAMCHSCCI